MRSYKPSQTHQSQDLPQDINSNRKRLAVHCLGCTFQGVAKRIKWQALSSLIIRSSKQDQKSTRLKFLAFISTSFIKSQKLIVFNRLLRASQHDKVLVKAVTNFMLCCKRLSKNYLKHSLSKLQSYPESKPQFNRTSNKNQVAPLISPRVSESSQRSNIFSVSDSENDEPAYQDTRHYRHADASSLKRENEELKRMVLSESAKESLLKMQRYNRFNYNTETQRVLKGPITDQLKRLERMKNEQKDMRNKFYDNELTITCLYNHIRIISQMNQDMAESKTYKDKCGELEKKLSEVGFQHKRQINEFKRKLLLSGVKIDSSPTKNEPTPNIQSSPSKHKEPKNQSFQQQQTTTLNVLTTAIKAKKYKDIKRQIEHLVKTSQKHELNSLMKELLLFMGDMETMDEGGRQKDKEKIQILNVINLIDKNLRADKTDDLEALKNKSKAHAHLNQLCVLIETIIGLTKQLKTIKKRQSTSADRFKSAEKDKIKKTLEKENQELKRQVKGLQAKNSEITVQLQRIKESLKKVDRVHPSLLPKKQTQKDLPILQIKTDDTNKKIKEIEANYSKKMEALSKQYSLKFDKSKQIEEKLDQKIKDLQEQLQIKKREQIQFKAIRKQLQDFKRTYSDLRQKIQNKEAYTKDINQFKRLHRESSLLQVLQQIVADENNKTALITQLRNAKALFLDGSWRRRQNNILIKSQEEIYIAVNQLLELILGLYKEKEENAASTKELPAIKQRDIKLTEQNKTLKEEVIGLKAQIRKQKEQLSIKVAQKQQSSSATIKSKTPERIQRSSADKQVTQLLAQNQKLKRQIESKKVSSSLENQLKQQTLLSKEYQDAIKCFQTIKKKRSQKQSYQANVLNFKKNYNESVFSDLFQALSAEESNISRVITLVKAAANAFSDGSWKRKQNGLKSKEQSEPFLSLNQIIQLSSNLLKEREQASKQTKEGETLRNQNISLSTQIIGLKQENLKIKNEMQQISSALSKERSVMMAEGNNGQKIKLLQAQIVMLKQDVEQKKGKITNLEDSARELADKVKIAEQLSDLKAVWAQIQSKLASGIACQKDITNFYRSHPRGACRDILQSLVAAERQALALTNHFKTLVEVFSCDGWKKKTRLIIKGKQPYYDYLNQISQLMHSLSKGKEQITTESLTLQNQINSSHREIEALQEQISRLRSNHTLKSKQLSPSRQISLEQHRQLNELKLLNDNMAIENRRLNAELQNAIRTNGLSNTQIDRLAFQLAKLQKETNTFKQAESYQRNKDIQIQKMQNRVNQLELNLQNSDEKVKNYTALFQKYKEERNNLYTMIQQRDKQYELSKENQQLHIKEKQERDEKIFQLRHRYEETQINIKEIQREVDRLLAEREHLNVQRQTTEQTLRRQLEKQQKQFAIVKASLIEMQKMCYTLQNKLEMAQMRSKNELAMKENQRQYLQKQIAILRQQVSQLKQKLLEQRKELRDRYQVVNKQLLQQRKFRQEERSLLKQRMQEYSQVHMGKGSTILMAEDQEKKELRRQLQLVNQQLAVLVRNSQNQKRQMRQYVDKINNDIQMQTILYNEEKKILKEDVERARNQEYQIHHSKLTKLREDIQALREENQRLISIIDSNETAFNELINEHREMSMKISQLSDINSTLADQNAELDQQLSHANRDKQNLAYQLKVLQDRLGVLEQDITSAIEAKGVNNQELLSSQVREEELRGAISQLDHQKKILEGRLVEQGKENVELYKQIMRLESDLQRSAASHQNRQTQGDYSLYLQEKLNHSQKEIKRYIENEKNLITKIENLMRNISSLEREKMQYHSSKRQKQIELAFQRNNNQKQILHLQQQIIKLEEALAQRQRQFITEKPQQQPYQSLVELENKLNLQIAHNKKLISDIQKLKATIQELKRQRTHLQIKIDSNSKAIIEAKIMRNKYSDLQLQLKQLQIQAQSYQDEVIYLKRQLSTLSRSSQPAQQLDFLNHRSATLKKDQEIMWLNSQLSSREHQIQKLRSSNIQLSHTVKRFEEKLGTIEHVQVRYTRQVNSHEETRRQKKDIEEFYKQQLLMARTKERQAQESLMLCNQNLRVLNQSYQQLSLEYKHLKDQAQNRRAESQALRQIVFQLDSDYVLEDNDEELQLKILQKISQQITELLDSNKQLKAKCQNLELSIFDNSTEASQQTVIYSLHTMTENLLLYLQAEALLTAQSVANNLRQLLLDSNNTLQTYISNLEVFLKTLILSLKEKSSEESLNYHYRIENIRRAVQNYVNYSNSENLSKLKETL